ncbi:hypothetical protein L2E82_46301 [Cichorium intybus]|uniref:Uncharacterized protein n=1 Tax=Cichorium intybus TaxID=13427 RepID=A0ACB8YSV0_CICIN|nr:hypothetical protein L2E82_46301 [Cichorium intybus]
MYGVKCARVLARTPYQFLRLFNLFIAAAADLLQNFAYYSLLIYLADWKHFERRLYQRENMAGEEAVVPVEAPAAPALGEPMDIMTALQLVLRKSLAHGGLVRGLHEAAKVIEKHAALLCVLAEDCNQPDYQKLVKALCADHNVSLVTVPAAKTLGEWAGLCKIDSEGKARKVVGCSCLVVRDYGEESEGLHIVQEYVKSH